VNTLLIIGLLGLIVGWFFGRLGYKRKLNILKNEFKLELNKINDGWETKVEKINTKHTTKIEKEKSSMDIKIKELIGKNKSRDIEIESIKKSLLIANKETQNVEKRLKYEYRKEIKKHKNRVSTLLNRVNVGQNKDLNDLVMSLITLEGNAIKEEAELRYKLKDTQERLENKISNLKREVLELKSEIDNLLEEKKIGITIGPGISHNTV
jgi:hypothetical protein